MNHTYIHTYIHTYMHACIRTYVHIYTNCSFLYIHNFLSSLTHCFIATGLFTMHPYTKAVIELVPFVYDSLYYKNYIQDLGSDDVLWLCTFSLNIFTLFHYAATSVPIMTFNVSDISSAGFADYVVSSGHLTPKPTVKVNINDKGTSIGNSSTFCAFTKYSDFAARGCTATKV